MRQRQEAQEFATLLPGEMRSIRVAHRSNNTGGDTETERNDTSATKTRPMVEGTDLDAEQVAVAVPLPFLHLAHPGAQALMVLRRGRRR